jgi:hypothetical protein
VENANISNDDALVDEVEINLNMLCALLLDEVGEVDRVRNRTLTLIEREDDTRSWGNFLVYFSHYHNAMPSKGLGIHTYRLLASQEYARC